MKLYKYLFIAALAAGFTACDGGGIDDYEPAATPTGAQVYFDSADNGMAVSLADGQTEVTVPIYRAEGGGALTVNLTLTDESGLITIPGGSVTFAAGQKEANVTLAVNFSAIEANKKYPFTIAVPAADASLYAVASLEGTIEFAPWTEWTKLGTGNYTYNGLFTGVDSGLDAMWRQSLIDPNSVEFQILNVLTGVTMNISGTKATTQDGKTVYILSVPEQETGYIYADLNAMVYYSDLYHYVATYDTASPEPYKNASVYDPETGEFAMAMIYYIPNQGKFGNGAYEYFQLDGFMTYSIDLNANGHYVAPDGTDYALVQCHLSDGLGSAQYTAVAGNLSDAEVDKVVEDMIAGTIESETTNEPNGYLTFTFPETGMYTVVVAGFNAEGSHVCTASLPVAYIPVGSNGPNVDDDPDWTTLGYCTYTDDFLPALTDEIGPETFEVKIQESKEHAGYYRLVDAYGPAGYGFPFVDATKNYFMYIDATDPEAVILDTDNQGVRPFDGWGDMYTSSMAAQQIAGGASPADVKAAGICGTLEGGFVTFPEQQLMIGLVNESTGGLNGWKANLNGAFEVDMSALTTEARSHRALRTSVRRPMRVYGNPVASMVIKQQSFIGKVTTKEIIEYNKKHLRRGNL